MPVALSSLRIEAELDASRYVAGAQQKAAADQRMFKVASRSTKASRRPSAGWALRRPRSTGSRAQPTRLTLRASVLRAACRALDTGRISQEQYGRLLDQTDTRSPIDPHAAPGGLIQAFERGAHQIARK